jgi:hypothetical protein
LITITAADAIIITELSVAGTMVTGSDSGCLPRSERAALVRQEACMTEPYFITRPLTRELDDTSSPVRQFLADRFTAGLRGVQRRPDLRIR